MKDYQTADIRNFAIVGHGGCGKTILSESILVNGGIINRIGSVEAGNTVSDYHPGEKDFHPCSSTVRGMGQQKS